MSITATLFYYSIRAKRPCAHLSTTLNGGFTPFLCITECDGRKLHMNTGCDSVWFNLTRNRALWSIVLVANVLAT